MVRVQLVKFSIIILVTGFSLNWIMAPVLATELTQEQINVEKSAASIKAERDFLEQAKLSDEVLLEESGQYQEAYTARWKEIQADFDRGVEFGQLAYEQQIENPIDELTDDKSQFFKLGVHEGYQKAQKESDNEPHVEINNEPQDKNVVSKINSTSVIPSSPHKDDHTKKVDPVISQQQRPMLPNVVSPLPRGVITGDHQKFINRFATTAQIVAQEHNLYASVMIAQAVLESSWGNSGLSQTPYYNLFGIKGLFAGKAVTMQTKEDNGKGNLFTIDGRFRQYPSYRASLDDYATIMLQPIFAKAWRSNTKSYRDATAALTGTYATDTSYAVKLNQIIETYKLTKYDRAPSVQSKPTIISHKLKQNDTLMERQTQKNIGGSPKVKDANISIPSLLGLVGLGISGWWMKRRV